MTLQRLKARERQKRRALILGAAQRLFSRRGLSEVSMRDIARRAGVSVGFIYRHFRSRSEIFVELFEENARAIFRRIEADIGAGGPAPLKRAAENYVAFLLENRMFFEMMSHFMLEGRLSEKALSRVNETLRRLIDGVEPAFADGRPDSDSRALAHAFFAALNGVMISFAKYPGRTSQEIKERAVMLARTIAERFESASDEASDRRPVRHRAKGG